MEAVYLWLLLMLLKRLLCWSNYTRAIEISDTDLYSSTYIYYVISDTLPTLLILLILTLMHYQTTRLSYILSDILLVLNIRHTDRDL